MARPRRHRGQQRVREAAASYPRPASPGLTGILLDSDVIIDVLRGRAAIARAIAGVERQGVPTYCSAVSWAEVFAGVRPGEEAATEAFFLTRGEAALDAVTARRAGIDLARYARSHGVGIADALVAATASTTGLALWTLNRRHYPMDDLQFHENP